MQDKTLPVVLLAHGYLGSRFDLSHFAEALAGQGFVCVSPEYPESLSASYDASQLMAMPPPNSLSRAPQPMDRSLITSHLFYTMASQWDILDTTTKPSSVTLGVIGHSLGCRTAAITGDDKWCRVCIAGGLGLNPTATTLPSPKFGPTLVLASINDNVASLNRIAPSIPANYQQFHIQQSSSVPTFPFSSKVAVLFENAKDAPNHISYLAENTCDAMMVTLSPLLPLARLLGLPVLDFDQYSVSKDADRTAKVMVPLVVDFLAQYMKGGGEDSKKV